MANEYQCPRCGCGLTLERLRLRADLARENAQACLDKMPFTPREREAVQMVLEGMRNREIAEKMGNTVQVIKNRLRRIFDVAGVETRGQLIAKLAMSEEPEKKAKRLISY